MRARLHTPEWTTILPINRAGTRVDELAQEPTAHQARGAAIRLRAQVDETDRGRRTPGQAGATETDRLMVTYLRTDVDRAQWTPQAGDRLSLLEDLDGTNQRAQNLYLVEAHYTAKDGRRAKLVQCTFEARSPRRTVREGL